MPQPGILCRISGTEATAGTLALSRGYLISRALALLTLYAKMIEQYNRADQ
jgi:hypothetical protein